MECGTAKTLMELFCIGYTTIALRCGGWVGGSARRGSVLCGRGRRITENIRVEVDGARARQTPLCSSGRSSMETPLFMVLKLPPSTSIPLQASLPLSLQAPSPLVGLNGLLPPHLSPLLRLIVIPSAILSPHSSYLWTIQCQRVRVLSRSSVKILKLSGEIFYSFLSSCILV